MESVYLENAVCVFTRKSCEEAALGMGISFTKDLRYTHMYQEVLMVNGKLPYSGKLSREKTFTNFAIFQPSAKVFSTKF